MKKCDKRHLEKIIKEYNNLHDQKEMTKKTVEKEMENYTIEDILDGHEATSEDHALIK